jgi:hypothetical protein
MTPSGIGIRSATVTAAVVLAVAGWLTTTAPARAAAPDPSSTAQPSPTPPPTTTSDGTTDGQELTLDPTSARPGDPVAVSFDGWDFKGCTLDYDQAAQPTSTCTVANGVLSGSVTVPSDATPNTAVPIIACPSECNGDNAIATASLTILPPLVTSRPTPGHAGGVVTGKPRHHHRLGRRRHHHHHRQHLAASSTSDHTATLVTGGAVVVFLASALGLLLLRRRPPTTGPPPDVHLVPRPDPGVVTVDPDRAADNPVTIRLRPDEVHCRVEAMQR